MNCKLCLPTINTSRLSMLWSGSKRLCLFNVCLLLPFDYQQNKQTRLTVFCFHSEACFLLLCWGNNVSAVSSQEVKTCHCGGVLLWNVLWLMVAASCLISWRANICRMFLLRLDCCCCVRCCWFVDVSGTEARHQGAPKIITSVGFCAWD